MARRQGQRRDRPGRPIGYRHRLRPGTGRQQPAHHPGAEIRGRHPEIPQAGGGDGVGAAAGLPARSLDRRPRVSCIEGIGIAANWPKLWGRAIGQG